MKNIIKSLLVITAVAAVATTATKAYFSSTATSKDNTFSAGTLTLELKDDSEGFVAGDISTSFGGTNLYPGQKLAEQTMSVKNSGSIDADHLVLDIDLTVGNDSDLAKNLIFPYTPNEYNGMRFGISSNTGESMNMLAYLRGGQSACDNDEYGILYDPQNDGTFQSACSVLSGDTNISLQDIVNLGKLKLYGKTKFGGLTHGTTAVLIIHPEVDTDLTTQGQTVKADFKFTLNQHASQN